MKQSRKGFTLLELAVILAIIIILSGIAVPNISNLLASTRIQNAAMQMLQDLREVHDDAVLYQQDLRMYLCTGGNSGDSSTYCFERTLKDPTKTGESQHYQPGELSSSSFVARTLPYGVHIESVSFTGDGWLVPVTISGRTYKMMYFHSGTDVYFRGQPSANGTIALVDQSGTRHMYVIIDTAGRVRVSGNLSGS